MVASCLLPCPGYITSGSLCAGPPTQLLLDMRLACQVVYDCLSCWLCCSKWVGSVALQGLAHSRAYRGAGLQLLALLAHNSCCKTGKGGGPLLGGGLRVGYRQAGLSRNSVASERTSFNSKYANYILLWVTGV